MVNDFDGTPADEVVAEIMANGGEAIAHVGSVTTDGYADDFMAAAIEAFGAPDILVNNAGYTWDSMIHKASDEQFDTMYDIHLKVPILGRAFIDQPCIN